MFLFFQIFKNDEKVMIDVLKYLVDEKLVTKLKNNQIIGDFKEKFEQENPTFCLNNFSSNESDVLKSSAVNGPTQNGGNSVVFSSVLSQIDNSASNDIDFNEYSNDLNDLPKNIINLDQNSNFKFK